MNIWTLILLLCLITAIIAIGLTWLICTWAFKWRHIGKTWTFTIPDIPGTRVEATRRKLSGGYYDRPSDDPNAQRDDKDRIIPSGPATYPSNVGPIQFINASGFSLVAPSKQEAANVIEKVFVADWISKNKKLPAAGEPSFVEGLAKAVADGKQLATRFQIWDPRTYYKAARESVMQMLYQSAGDGKDPWYAKAAFFGVMVVGFMLLIVLGILMVKIVPAVAAASGG